MALPSVDISIAAVKTALGEASNDLAGLCVSRSINKWSRFKPFRSAVLFHDSTDDILADTHYRDLGLSTNDITGIESLVAAAAAGEGWTYIRPDSVFRLGDFRLYSHSAAGPVLIISFDHRTLEGEDVIIGDGSTDVSYTANTDEHSVRLSDLAFLTEADWRFGCCLAQGEDGIVGWGTVTGGAELGSRMTVPLTGAVTRNTYRIYPFLRIAEMEWGSAEPSGVRYAVFPKEGGEYLEFKYYSDWEDYYEEKMVIAVEISSERSTETGKEEYIEYYAKASTAVGASGTVAYTNCRLIFYKLDGTAETLVHTVTLEDFTLTGYEYREFNGEFLYIHIGTGNPKYMDFEADAEVTLGTETHTVTVHRRCIVDLHE